MNSENKRFMRSVVEQFEKLLIEAEERLVRKYADFMSEKDLAEAEERINQHKEDYRRKYNGDFR